MTRDQRAEALELKAAIARPLIQNHTRDQVVVGSWTPESDYGTGTAYCVGTKPADGAQGEMLMTFVRPPMPKTDDGRINFELREEDKSNAEIFVAAVDPISGLVASWDLIDALHSALTEARLEITANMERWDGMRAYFDDNDHVTMAALMQERVEFCALALSDAEGQE